MAEFQLDRSLMQALRDVIVITRQAFTLSCQRT
jgi:hypothetical protein